MLVRDVLGDADGHDNPKSGFYLQELALHRSASATGGFANGSLPGRPG